MDAFLDRLRFEAWTTASARYTAARRLRRRELFATVSLALFSAISVGIAFIQRIYVTNGSTTDNYLTALSGCLGILLLTISLMEWGSANGAKAETLHRNAEDLNAFQRKVFMVREQLGAGVAMTWADVETLRIEYESIKTRCPYNHDPIDDACFRASHRSSPEFQNANGKPRIGPIRKAWIMFLWYWKSVWYLGLFWAAIAIAIYFALPVSFREG